MAGREVPERSDRVSWPVVIVGALALFGAITLVQFVLGLAFTLAKLLIVAAIVAVAVAVLRGPPDGQ